MPRVPGVIWAYFLVGLSYGAIAADAGKKTAPTPPVERALVSERSQDDAQALARQLPADEQQSLQAGSETFMALWKPANKPDPEGAVILLPGAGESADWPKAVGPLRRALPDIGWSSLSLTLPDLASEASLIRGPLPEVKAPTPVTTDKQPKGKDAPPPSNKPDQTATDPATAEIQGKVEAERIFARIDAAIAYAKTQKASSIALLGHGSGAYWAVRYLSEHQTKDIEKVVLVAAQSPFSAKPTLNDLAPALKITVGDFYYRNQPDAKKLALQRMEASKRLSADKYRQVGLEALPGNSSLEQEQLLRRIRGVLSPIDVGSPPSL